MFHNTLTDRHGVHDPPGCKQMTTNVHRDNIASNSGHGSYFLQAWFMWIETDTAESSEHTVTDRLGDITDWDQVSRMGIVTKERRHP